jgi:lipoprotein-anchoring transpeptidase ErfK/SrfK
MSRTGYRLAVVALLALAGAAAVRFMGGSEAAVGDRPVVPAAARAQAVAPVAPPVVSVGADQSGTVPADRPLEVGVADGTLSSVAVEDGRGQPVPGEMTADGRGWRSSEPPVPQTAYTVRVTALGADGRSVERTLAVMSGAPSTALHATLSPGDGDVVGIGMPAVVSFDRPVATADRPAVEARLRVTANPAAEGDWRWISPSLVHWRPAVYWQPGTEVDVRSDLRGLKVGDAWGTDQRSVHFRIGDAHVTTVDVASHQMTVTENGRVVRVIAASTGRDRYPTANGVHLALEKSRTVTMDSATVGIPRDSPNGYYRTVAWATRLSYSGTYVHAAPWSAGAQGERNVSHGCINVSTADAEWFFNFTRRGDVVDVVNSPAPPKLADPGMADWNIPWEQWKAGDTAA